MKNAVVLLTRLTPDEILEETDPLKDQCTDKDKVTLTNYNNLEFGERF